MLRWPIRRRSWLREHRASCGERMRDPSGPRARVSASSAALRSTRRQDDKTRKRDVQTGGAARGVVARGPGCGTCDDALAFLFLGVGFPE